MIKTYGEREENGLKTQADEKAVPEKAKAGSKTTFRF